MASPAPSPATSRPASRSSKVGANPATAEPDAKSSCPVHTGGNGPERCAQAPAATIPNSWPVNSRENARPYVDPEPSASATSGIAVETARASNAMIVTRPTIETVAAPYRGPSSLVSALISTASGPPTGPP